MSIKSLFRKLLLLMTLQAGVFLRVPMRPEEVRELLNQMTRPKIAHTLPDEADKGKKKPDHQKRKSGMRIR